MSRMLADDNGRCAATARALFVRGIPYANSAAAFWLSILREVREDYPPCDAMFLTALMEGPLQADMLFPTLALEREIQRTMLSRRPDSLDAMIAECELLGLPGGVELTLRAGHRQLCARELPRDCVDAEIFAYLLAWLLEWAEIPEAQWNAEQVAGGFAAALAPAGERLALRLELENTHLSEGLYRRRLRLTWDAGALA